MYTAMAFGLIGNIFTSVWKDRDRILLMKKTRIRLEQWGYHPTQIPKLFKRFDVKRQGELDIFAFRRMIEAMRLGLSEERVNALFIQFDADRSGTIDSSEFIRHLFPKTFHQLFDANEGNSPRFESQDDSDSDLGSPRLKAVVPRKNA
mmetsp:Transcript_30290/g.48911  ORF Transcript_30290/g.48911 Transcript_30290/m.48911 type:complete len:148 (-) Transcript_30290:22-465(-)